MLNRPSEIGVRAQRRVGLGPAGLDEPAERRVGADRLGRARRRWRHPWSSAELEPGGEGPGQDMLRHRHFGVEVPAGRVVDDGEQGFPLQPKASPTISASDAAVKAAAAI